MTAGSGVVHSEMPSERFRNAGGLFEGFQLWVNLPAKDKMVKPRYQDTPPEKIPVIQLPGECNCLVLSLSYSHSYPPTYLPISLSLVMITEKILNIVSSQKNLQSLQCKHCRSDDR